MLSLEQKMSMAQTAHSQFEQAYQLVVAINGPLARNGRGMSLANYCAKGSISVTWQSRFSRCGCA